jgi:uncharacterized protein
MKATPIYSALLAIVFIVLSIRTIRLRGRFRIPLGDGRQRILQRAMRVHANFAEYVPFALLLLYFLEVHTAAYTSIHVLGIALVAGRILHAYGVSHEREQIGFRVAGMVLTFGVLSYTALALLFRALLATSI